MQPIDLSHLGRQTGEDAGLEREVLRLFAARSTADLDRLKAAAAPGRREVAHLIVGSARAVGAGEVARLAAEIEAGGGDIAALEAAIGEARRFIAGYLGS